MESDEKESQVVFPPEVFGIRVDDPEVLKACWYLMQRDQNKTIEEIGLVLGYSSRQSVYNLVHKWEDSGVLKKAREIYLIPKGEEIKVAETLILDEWPAILRKIKSIALHSRSDHVSLEAAEWLRVNVVEKHLGNQADPDNAERAYADKKPQAAPNVVTIPAFLKKSE